MNRRERAALSGLVHDDPDPTYQPLQPGEPFPPGDVDLFSAGPVDIRGVVDWLTIWSMDVRKFSWGMIVVDAVRRDWWDTANFPNLILAVHAQCRILGYLAGTSFIISEGVLGNALHHPTEISISPMRSIIGWGEMPDRIEVQVRARRGGKPMIGIEAQDVLQATLTARLK